MPIPQVLPQQLKWRLPAYYGRKCAPSNPAQCADPAAPLTILLPLCSDLETLLASDSVSDWVRLSVMLLGPPPAGFRFEAKHKSSAYAKPGSAEAEPDSADVQG